MTATRIRIAETAREIFAADGVDGVSMRRVAAEVGITPTAIYRLSQHDALPISTWWTR